MRPPYLADAAPEEELHHLRAEIRSLREQGTSDLSTFKTSVHHTLEDKNREIGMLHGRVDDLSAENERLRQLLSRSTQTVGAVVEDCHRCDEKDAAVQQHEATISKLQRQVADCRDRCACLEGRDVSNRERAEAESGTMRLLCARVGELQRLVDNMESSLDVKTLTSHLDNPYEDEAAGGIDVEATTIGCQPDPVSVGHEVQCVIITRNADGMPCRGASPSDFDVTPVGRVSNVSPVTGSRSCFTVTFVPEEVGRVGLCVLYRGHRMACTTSCVRDSEPFDSKQTAIMLSPNPAQAGVTVTGTIIAKTAQGVVTRLPSLSGFDVELLGHAGGLTRLVACGRYSSQATFSFVPTAVGRSGVELLCDGESKTAAVEVVDVTTPAISTMHTVLCCTPNPARVGEEVTVVLTTRSGAGVPTAGASVDDLRSLRPVGAAAQLQAFETLSPSSFRTTFVARKAGSAGLAVSFMGLTLYSTTTVAAGADELDAERTTLSCLGTDISADMPVEVLITSRDRWGAPFPCRSESMWSLSAKNSALEIVELRKTGCCTLKGTVRPLRAGPATLELLHCNTVVTRVVLDVKPRQEWDPSRTRLVLKKDTGEDLPVSILTAPDGGLGAISCFDSALLVITTHSAKGRRAIGPTPDTISVLSIDASPITQVSEGVYVCQVYNFRPGVHDVEVDVDGLVVSTAISVARCAPVASPYHTQVECRPSSSLVGDTVSAFISFFDSAMNPANAPDPSELMLEPIGGIAKLTRVAPQVTRGSSSLEVLFEPEEVGAAGLVVRHGECAYECTTAVCAPDSLNSGPLSIAAADVSLSPHPVRPGHQVQVVVTLRDSRYNPLHNVNLDPLQVVVLPLENTAKVSSNVRLAPGTAGTWVTSFTAGPNPGETGVAVEVNGHRMVATTVVQDDPFGAMDDELMRLKELTNRLHDEVERDALDAHARREEDADRLRLAEDQLLVIESSKEKQVIENETRRKSRNKFAHFGLELTDSVKFGKSGSLVEYGGVKVVASKGAARKAGIVSDMIITKVEGTHVELLSDFKQRVREVKPGETVTITVRAIDGREQEFSVRPDKSAVPSSQRVGYTRKIRVSAVDMELMTDDASPARSARRYA